MRPGHRTYRAEPLESRTLLSAQLVRDINTSTMDSNPAGAVALNDQLYFTARDGSSATGLWKSDGTAAGTIKWDDLQAVASNVTVVNGRLVFWTPTTRQVWSSDGTAQGTAPLLNSSNVYGVIAGPGAFYFTDRSPQGDYRLWHTDGTASGTVVVKDHMTSPPLSNSAVAPGGRLFFSYQNVTTLSLWVSDGTAAGTVSVASLFADSPAAMKGGIIFSASDGVTGNEPWYSDGTAAGTTRLQDIVPGSGSSFPVGFTAATDVDYFVATAATGHPQLWKTDGTPAGTVLVKDLLPQPRPQLLGTVGDRLFFSADDGAHGPELWTSDGTTGGTFMVKDLRSGSAGSAISLSAGAAAVGGNFYFVADDGTHGAQLWRTDGTGAGTSLVTTFSPGATSPGIQVLASAGAKLFFSATTSPTGRELFVTDGTPGGTSLVVDINTNTADAIYQRQGSSPVTSRAALPNGSVIFAADDGIHGAELWETDGTADGTTLLADINPGAASSYPDGLTTVGNEIFFTVSLGGGSELWKTDGTAAGTVRVKNVQPVAGAARPTGLIEVGGTLFFWVTTGGASQLWKSDGTSQGTVLVQQRAEMGPLLGETITDGKLVFATTPIFSGGSDSVWVSDGTPAGTYAFATADSGAIGALTPFGQGVLFEAQAFNGASDQPELFRWNGSGAAQNLQFDGNSPTDLGDGMFVFTRRQVSSPYGSELWASDGSVGGETKLTVFSAVGIFDVARVGNSVLFTADGGTSGLEVWRTDGTQRGTVLVKDLNPGPGSSSPSDFVTVDGIVYFTADDGTHGRTWWHTDGTPGGTQMMPNSSPAPWGIPGSPPTYADGALYYAVNAAFTGSELWRLAPLSPPLPPSVAINGTFDVNEGGTVRLSASGTLGATYEWDFNYDGSSFHVDATGSHPIFAAGRLDGPSTHPIAVRVTLNGITSAVAAGVVNIHDVPPTLTVSGSASVVVGQPYTISLNYHDPGPDTPTGWKIDWGDHSSDNLDGSAQSVSHIYLTAGRYLITATATDQDGPHVTSAATPVQLDSTFANNGTGLVMVPNAINPFGPYGIPSAEGAIIVTSLQNGWVVSRLNAAGAVDPSFGTNGSTTQVFSDSPDTHATVICSDDAGGVYVGGRVYNPALSDDYDWVICHYLADGKLDPGFASGGVFIADFGGRQDIISAMAVDPNEKLVVAGTSNALYVPGNVIIARLNLNGSYDTSFNGTGQLIKPYTQTVAPGAIAFDAVGQLILAGNSEPSGTSVYNLAAMRLHADGSLDTGFGGGGMVTVPLGYSNATAIAVNGGRILLAGNFNEFSTLGPAGVLAQLTSDGRLDPSFAGGAGWTTFHGPNPLAQVGDDISALALQPDGRILVAGTHDAALGVLFRFNPDGAIDPTFNGGQPLVSQWLPANSMWVTPDGNAFTVGEYAYPGQYGSALSRYDVEGVAVTPVSSTGNTSGGGRQSVPTSPATIAGGAAQPSDALPASVSGEVFRDLFGTGTWSPSDPPVANWTVYCDLNGNGAPDSGEPAAITNSSGLYALTNVPAGTQAIRVVLQAGWQTSPPGSGGSTQNVQLSPGQNAYNVNFAVQPAPATFQASVFNDLNADGIRTPDEPGLAGWMIFLDANHNSAYDPGEEITTTDASGRFSITEPAGTYAIGVTPVAGWTLSAPLFNVRTYTVTAGQQVAVPDYGFVQVAPAAVVGGTLFLDANANGIDDPGEQPLVGWLVYDDANHNGAHDTGEIWTLSDSAGHYSLLLRADEPQDIRLVTPQSAANDYPTLPLSGFYTVLPSDQIAQGLDFGLAQGTLISGNVINDLDGDGVYPDIYDFYTHESALANWDVEVYDSGASSPGTWLTTAITGADGSYHVNLHRQSGTFTLVVDVPPNWQTSAGASSTVVINSPGQSLTGVNFLVTTNAIVSGYVYEDKNLDGVFDAGDEPLAIQSVFLDLNNDGIWDGSEPLTSTDPSGHYQFGGIPSGPVAVRSYTIPQGYRPVTDAPVLTVAPGARADGVNLGFSTTALISGSVFIDATHNGALDPGEQPLTGVTVYLDLNNNGIQDANEPVTTTDALGIYRFAVGAGTYSVRQVAPPGYRRTTPLPVAPIMASAGAAVAGPIFGDTLVSSVPMDFAYLLTLAQHYNQPGTFAKGDLNDDETVNFSDLLLLAQNYGRPLSATAAAGATVQPMPAIELLKPRTRPERPFAGRL